MADKNLRARIHSQLFTSGNEDSTVKVLFLPSWGQTSVWEDLKTNWPKYGNIPVSIDDSTYIGKPFTYQDLVDSGADVIVISDPAGGYVEYSDAEISAVAQYARDGHVVLGTFLVFYYHAGPYGVYDNRALAPVFGLSATSNYNNVTLSNLFRKLEQDECLFTNMPANWWQSYGYPQTQKPGNWRYTLAGASVAAESDYLRGLVTLYKPQFAAKAYTAIYISNYPEYNGGTLDEQLLYNASTCYVTK